MKLNKYIWLAAMPMLFAACQNDTLDEGLQQKDGIYTLSGKMSGGVAMSRAQVVLGNTDSSRESFMWNEGDAFALYQGSNNGLSQHVFTINSDYSETGTADKKSATFSTENPALAMKYTAVYPSHVEVDGNDAHFSFQSELDFTAATTKEEQNLVWAHYLQNNMFMMAKGELTNDGVNVVDFQHLCAMARITYTNETDASQTFDYIRLGSGQQMTTSMSYNLVDQYECGSGSTSWYQIETPGLTVASGESTDFYIMFFPSDFNMDGTFQLLLKPSDKDEMYAEIPVSDIAAANAGDAGFAAGKRYWFKLTGFRNSMLFSKDYSTAPIVFDNVELAAALQGVLGSDVVTIDPATGFGTMIEADVLSIKALHFGWNGEYHFSSLDGIEHFKNLTHLNCHNTGLVEADLSQNTALVEVELFGNSLTRLDLNNHTSLFRLNVGGNPNLTSLNFDKSEELRDIVVNESGLTSLDIPNKEIIQILEYGGTALTFDLNEFPNLKHLSIYSLGLTSLDLIPSKIKGQLIQLQCYNNEISTIDLSEYSSMEYLSIYANNFTSLDLTPVPGLKELNCHSCNIESLDITPLTQLENLYCGQQRDNRNLILTATESQKDRWRTYWSLPDNSWGLNDRVYLEGEMTEITFSNTALSAALYNELGADKVTLNADGTAVMMEYDVKSVESLSFSGAISSLDGIEYFVNLNQIYISSTNLETCDLSQNTKLQFVTVQWNDKLTALNLGNNADLMELRCSFNDLYSLDISNSDKLYILDVENNYHLESLDIPNPSLIGTLYIGNTQLEVEDMTEYTNLTTLDVDNMNLYDLDFIPSAVKAQLTTLFCDDNHLSVLDLTQFPMLTDLHCHRNNIEELNVPAAPELRSLMCTGNKISSLDISGWTYIGFLECGKQQDDSTLYLTMTEALEGEWYANWSSNSENANVELGTGDEGEVNMITIQNAELAVALQAVLGADKVTINSDGYAVMKESDVLSVTTLDFGWGEYTITSLDGIEYFTNLQTLYCNETNLAECDLSQNKELRNVVLCGALFETLDLSNQTELEYVGCAHSNTLKNLILTNCTNLNHIECMNTPIAELHIPNPEKMDQLIYGGNQSLSVDLNKFTNLRILGIQNMGLTELVVPDFLKLQLTDLYLNNNQLTSLDLSEFPKLEGLSCGGNKLTSLDLSVVPNLMYLDCTNNQLSTLDITSLEKLTNLDCGAQSNESILTLILTADQESKWNTNWINSWGNTNVTIKVD